MTKEIITLTATMLGLDDVVNYLASEGQEDNAEAEAVINELLVYLNHTAREVTKEYFTLSKCDEVKSSTSCEIEYSSLSETPVKINNVTNSLNLKVNFLVNPTCLVVSRPNETYKVFYNYTPAPVKSIDDDINLPLGLGYFVLCYGVASEYALSKLLYDEANMWQSKFVSSLERLTSRCKERRFFARKLK